MKHINKGIVLLIWAANGYAQDTTKLQDTTQTLEAVTITATAKRKMETDMKMVISIDEFLASSERISFIKRGAFAWEPLLNNMTTERSSITIDGMHVFGACTDKMDPITSYIESNNLSTIDISSGQQGSMHGATVAGNIDLKRKSTSFSLEKQWRGIYQTGFESNNKHFFHLGNMAYSSDRLVLDASLAFRKASSYFDGHKERIDHSQYHKINASFGLALKTGKFAAVRVDAIYDQAKDVGYPGLPMDLGLSRAFITSLSYKQLFEEGLVKSWDTKLYFNALEHYMDDTKRPENLVHMDMPGWSTTYGLLSNVSLHHGDFRSEIQLNAYDNLSIAEMRMYPQDRSRQTMFAYTWPWVSTGFVGFAVNSSWDITTRSQLDFGASFGWHYNHSKYVEFNRIFYPEASPHKGRLLPGLHTRYQLDINSFRFSVGLGYGHRAPSVSEGYGYYIYNSFDRYDYVGNPNLKNEISYELNAGMGFKKERFRAEAKMNYFHIQHYIVGEILHLGSPMNYQSVGVKGYASLKYAKIFNLNLHVGYDLLEHLHWKGELSYSRARDDKQEPLPFIRPLSYQSSLYFMHRKFGAQLSVQGDLSQWDFSAAYGEDHTAAYSVYNLSMDYSFKIKAHELTLQFGVENLFNRYYSTYADWGNIPRMGRNVFTALKFNL